MQRRDTIKVKAGIVVLALLAVCFAVSISVFSEKNSGSRATDPPDPPTNPNPSNNAKGIVGDTVTLMWRLQPDYRGDHKEIDQSWVKVSTLGPAYSDSAPADIFDGSVDGTSLEISIDMATTYYWAVKSHDEDGWGDYSDWKFTTNFPPDTDIVKPLSGTERASVDIEFRGEAQDSDGDSVVKYQWESSLDGIFSEQKSFTYDQLSPGNHEIVFRAMDNKNQWSPITEDSSVQLTIEENNAPTNPRDILPTATHSLSPQLTWYPSTDEDGDSITYYLSIGSSAGKTDILDIETTKSFYTLDNALSYSTSYSNGKSVKNYYLEIMAVDEYGEMSDDVEQTLQVVNNQPTKPELDIKPDDPTINDDLTLGIVEESQDKDGDKVSYSITWFRNGEEMKIYEDKYEIPRSELIAGQKWEARVLPHDGIHQGILGKISTTIINTPPVVTIAYPIDGQVIYDVDPLVLSAMGTYDPDNTDPYELTDTLIYRWRSGSKTLYDGEEQVYIIENNPLELGDNEIVLEVFDGKDTVQKEVTIKMMEKKYPKLTAKIIIEDTLIEGEKADITVQVTNIGDASAEDIDIILYNDKSGNKDFEPYEIVGSLWNIANLSAGNSDEITYSWIVEEQAKLYVKVDGDDLDAEDIKAITGNSNGGGNIAQETATPKEKGSESDGVPLWLWLIIGLLGLLVLGGIIFLVVSKTASYDEDDFEDDLMGIDAGLGQYAQEQTQVQRLQHQLNYLQNMIGTGMPQYAGYGNPPLALPPANMSGTNYTGSQPLLPPGISPYQTYSAHTPSDGYDYPPPRLALPPGPPGEQDMMGHNEINPFMVDSRVPRPPGEMPPFPPSNFPGQIPPPPGQGMPVGPSQNVMPPPPQMGSSVGSYGQLGAEIEPPDFSQLFADDIEGNLNYSDLMEGDGHYTESGKDPRITPKVPKPKIVGAADDIIKPKDPQEEEIIYCHICQSIIPDTGDKRPFNITCKNCGEEVMVE